MSEFDYDAVVIGSGVSGLTAALSLAQAGQRVAILEQHYLPGGWSHSFTFHHQVFCPGIHYIGELGPKERIRRLLEDLGIANDIGFYELNPDAYDHAVCPDASFDFPKGKDALRLRLTGLFPREVKGIDKYFVTCQRMIEEWEKVGYFANGWRDVVRLPIQAPTIARFAFCTFDEFLRYFFKDPHLRWILSTQCLNSGSSPNHVSGPFQAIVNWHYVNGGYYPKGGVKRIVGAYIKAFRRLGGELRMRAPVDRILVSDSRRRKVIGVRLEDGEEIRAGRVISSADVATTFQRLIDKCHLSRRLQWRLRRTRYSSSCASVYMVFDVPPSTLGLDSGNVFYSRSINLAESYELALSEDILQADHFPVLFLSTASAKDPDKGGGRERGYAASAFAPMSYGTFAHLGAGVPGQRSESYRVAKAKLSEMMIASVERVIPDVRRHLIAYDAGTPSTNRFYIGGEQGSMYGTEKSTEFVGPFAYGIKTEISNLYLCGHSTVGHGFIGGIISGRIAAAKALGCSVENLPRAKDQKLRIFPASEVRNNDCGISQ